MFKKKIDCDLRKQRELPLGLRRVQLALRELKCPVRVTSLALFDLCTFLNNVRRERCIPGLF